MEGVAENTWITGGLHRGEGADISRRVSWAKVLTRDEADRIKIDVVFPDLKEWSSYYSGE